jgi:demethylmenaquinone methyltransferase/2-methoxy-6-polyprenyl-1,4-benzoquinol methylase
MPEGPAIAEMFGGIAPRYDLANHVLSLGLDFGWRRCLVRAVAATKPGLVVDLATGSGDVALALKKHLGAGVAVRGYDFCRPMLVEAERKKNTLPWAQDIVFDWADCLALPLADDSADAVTIAFGLRNFADRARGLREMWRVLRPGGSLFVLEFTQPLRWLRPLYYFYLRHLMPVAAGLITGRPEAYRYLNASIAAFPDGATLAEEMRAAGFAEVTYRGLAACPVALHAARKSK